MKLGITGPGKLGATTYRVEQIPESLFQVALEKRLNAPKRWTCVARINSGAVRTDKGHNFRGAKKGTGDLVGFVRGRGLHLEVEAKTWNGKQSPAQKRRQKLAQREGWIYVLVRAVRLERATGWASERGRAVDMSVEIALQAIDAAIEARLAGDAGTATRRNHVHRARNRSHSSVTDQPTQTLPRNQDGGADGERRSRRRAAADHGAAAPA